MLLVKACPMSDFFPQSCTAKHVHILRLSIGNCRGETSCIHQNNASQLSNPLLPNISIHILHTVLCTFTKVLTRRICLTIKSFFSQ